MLVSISCDNVTSDVWRDDGYCPPRHQQQGIVWLEERVGFIGPTVLSAL